MTVPYAVAMKIEKKIIALKEKDDEDNFKCCEGCKEKFEDVETFFRHVSHAKKCKNVYGERYQIMRDDRQKEVQRKKQQNLSRIQHESNLEDIKAEFEEEGESLEDLEEDGYLIKCEGCNQLLQTDTFFRHASRSKKCKAAYGERLEIMKIEKRKKVKQKNYRKHKVEYNEKSKNYSSKNKESIAETKRKTHLDNISKENAIKRQKKSDEYYITENYNLEKKIRRLITAWKNCRDQDIKQFRKNVNMLKDAKISLEISLLLTISILTHE